MSEPVAFTPVEDRTMPAVIYALYLVGLTHGLTILIGAASRAIPAERRTLAVSLISSGGSLGQFVFAPLTQFLISSLGWVSAMLALSATALSTLPLAIPLRRRDSATLRDRSSSSGVS